MVRFEWKNLPGSVHLTVLGPVLDMLDVRELGQPRAVSTVVVCLHLLV